MRSTMRLDFIVLAAFLAPAAACRRLVHSASAPSDTCRSSRIGTMKIEKTTGLSGAVIQFAQKETATITQP